MLGPLANAADASALRAVAHAVPRPLATASLRVGQAANGGKLWAGCAGVLALTGSTGRRAAARGALAFVTAAAVANGPVKWAVRRRRPGPLATLGALPTGRGPRTSSFPSSHAAAAAAFSVAASMEAPLLAPILGPLAASVALSRLSALRHFPSDVAAGFALGAAVGLCTHLTLRRLERRSASADRGPPPAA